MARKRIIKELRDMENDGLNSLKARPVNYHNLFFWQGYIVGPDDTPYEGGIFFYEINIPSKYPFIPPKIKFTTKIYHPNIRSDGHSCKFIGDWSPIITIQKLLLNILVLFSNPDQDIKEDPSLSEVKEVYMNDRPLFNVTAQSWTKKYAQ